MKTKQKKTFVVIGAKWFDSVNGNTYHNAKIIDAETQKTYYCGYQYGYGSQYLTSAKEYIESMLKETEYILIDAGAFYIKKSACVKGWF